MIAMAKRRQEPIEGKSATWDAVRLPPSIMRVADRIIQEREGRSRPHVVATALRLFAYLPEGAQFRLLKNAEPHDLARLGELQIRYAGADRAGQAVQDARESGPAPPDQGDGEREEGG